MAVDAVVLPTLEPRRPFPSRLGPKGNLIYKLVTTTDQS